ncbi:MAG: protein-disulfide reductase DsbD family protein [Candidatus Nucleicultricaceae bacterium]
MRKILWLIAALFLLMPNISWATSQGVEHAKISLISPQTHLGNKKTLTIGLRFIHDAGWHTYWRSPGVAGYGVKIDWQGSSNLKKATLHWPAPERFISFGVPVAGYSKTVVLPITLDVKDVTKPLYLKAKLDYLICSKDECLPATKEVNLHISEGTFGKTEDAPLIESAIKSIPQQNPQTVRINHAEFIENDDGHKSLSFEINDPKLTKNAAIFVESPYKMFFDIPTITPLEKQGAFSVNFPVYLDELKKLAPFQSLVDESISLTVVEKGHAYTLQTFVSAAEPSWLGFLSVMILAFAGGFILNFMPCVLPVLSIKMMSLLKYSHGLEQKMQAQTLRTASGIIASFMTIALILVSLKWMGASIGWGMQFQQPIFLIFICFVLVLFAANLLGVFEFQVPRIFYRFIDNDKVHSESLKDVLEGVFATLLSTPCSAPMIGTAISFALSNGPIQIIFIFFLMSLGFSVPYILVALYPRLLSFMPKPGPWMLTLKRVLSIALFGTIVWLLWVLGAQVGFGTMLLIASGLMIFFVLLWAKEKTLKQQWLGVLVVALFIGTGSTALNFIAFNDKELPLIKSAWTSFDLALLQRSIKQNKLILVDVTADWCITCKFNEGTVLSSKTMHDYFKKNQVVLIRADWTSPSPLIASYLKSLNTFAIPAYIVYGPSNQTGIKLPQILTDSIVINAIEKAKAPSSSQ